MYQFIVVLLQLTSKAFISNKFESKHTMLVLKKKEEITVRVSLEVMETIPIQLTFVYYFYDGFELYKK